MKSIVLFCFVFVAVDAQRFFSSPFRPSPPRTQPIQRVSPIRPTQTFRSGDVIGIVRDNREDQGNGNFNYAFETENGITVEAVGSPGSAGQSNIRGSYSFPLPNGELAVVTYFADENGYNAQSPLIPTAHPLPAHAIEQIRFAEEQRARGITF